MSAAHINDKEEGELKLAYWKQQWEITKEILKTKEQNGSLTQAADKIIEGVKSFTNDQREKPVKQIKDKGAPEQLNRIRYQNFKDAANLISRYETEEDTKDKQDIIRERKCPTCQGNGRIKHT